MLKYRIFLPEFTATTPKENTMDFGFLFLNTILLANQNVGKVFLNNDIYHMTSKELTYCLFCFYVVLFFFFLHTLLDPKT